MPSYTFDFQACTLTASRKERYRYDVKVDTNAGYGYFEKHTGGEGGLWFERTNLGLELSDYDGASCLSGHIISLLRAAGFIVGTDFDTTE